MGLLTFFSGLVCSGGKGSIVFLEKDIPNIH